MFGTAEHNLIHLVNIGIPQRHFKLLNFFCRSLDRSESHDNHHLTTGDRDRRRSSVISSPRRTSAASSVSGIHSKKKRSLERSMVLTRLTYVL